METRRDAASPIELNPLFAQPGEATSLPRYQLPAGETSPATAYQVVHDEAMLDGNERLNLATFVGTWVDEYSGRLLVETATKNIVDKDEYPASADVEQRCWRMLAHLWHAPDPRRSLGASTSGSSEACMLAGLALKRAWQHRRRAAGADTSKPNLVMSSAVQVCWEKFCNFFEVEARYVPVSPAHPTLDAAGVAQVVDENTIGVVAIMGVTYTGLYEPVADIAAQLDTIHADGGPDVPIHVDGASGAMVAPFTRPSLRWDFQVPRVVSINTSGHKYGLVCPGLGWVVWRHRHDLPSDLVTTVSYLGGDMETFALTFSRPASQVLMQYYLFLRLGFEGYRRVQQACLAQAHHLAKAIEALGPFDLLSSGTDIPVVAWSLRGDHQWDLFQLSDRLRAHGWLVPAYPLPADRETEVVQRVVMRNGFSRDLADAFLRDLRGEVAHLEAAKPGAAGGSPGFHH